MLKADKHMGGGKGRVMEGINLIKEKYICV
jgi:hypothetical protein